MKQRVRVLGIIRDESRFFVVKRKFDRVEGKKSLDFPMTKIFFGEQPEDSITRFLDENFGSVEIEKIQIIDAITSIDAEISSRMANLFLVYMIKVHDLAVIRSAEWEMEIVDSSEIRQFDLGAVSELILDAIGDKVGIATPNAAVAHDVSEVSTHIAKKGAVAVLYVDGASRGNPGPSGVGYYITDQNGATIRRGGEFVGFNTGRVAEYASLREGLRQVLALGYERVEIVSDSLMMVNQVNGIYRVKNRDLLEPYQDVLRLLGEFKEYVVGHVTRDKNTIADAEANVAIDRWEERR